MRLIRIERSAIGESKCTFAGGRPAGILGTGVRGEGAQGHRVSGRVARGCSGRHVEEARASASWQAAEVAGLIAIDIVMELQKYQMAG